MQPLGRKKQRHGNKRKVRVNGKRVKAWWEDMVGACKRSDRQQAKRDIQEEIE